MTEDIFDDVGQEARRKADFQKLGNDENQDIEMLDDIAEKTIDSESDIKHLVTANDIELKTDLSETDITSITLLKELTRMTGIQSFETMANDYMKLRVSHDRKGRKEIVESHKSQMEERQDDLTQSVMGMFEKQ